MVFDPTVTPKKAGFIFRSLPVLGVFALLHGGVFAVQDVKTQPNPYLAISERNAFDLTDAPPPAKDTPTPELPKNLDLKFTGIYRLKGVEKACLALVDSSTKPPETKYLQIPVGDKQGAIEITAIDAEAGTVNLIKDGSPLELSLKNNEHTYKTAVAKAPSKSSKSRLLLIEDIIPLIQRFAADHRQEFGHHQFPIRQQSFKNFIQSIGFRLFLGWHKNNSPRSHSGASHLSDTAAHGRW